jgi:hypothetical protein
MEPVLGLKISHEMIASLDPLDASDIMKQVPAMNEAKDVSALAGAVRELLPALERVCQMENFEAAAASMRDIGIFLGSLKRHGVEPVDVVPALEPFLERLGVITQLPPRDTLLHYSVWNPSDERQRTYTREPSEVHLIESVRMSLPGIETSIERLGKLYDIVITSPDFIPLARQIAQDLEKLADAIIYAHKGVSHIIFAQILRPYYDPIKVGGKEYLGPGAVEMPLFIFDHVFWGSKTESPTYNKYKESLIPYVLPSLRPYYYEFKGKNSLTDKVIEDTTYVDTTEELIINGSQAMHDIFNVLIRFRAPHLKVAARSYSSDAGNQKTKGSGGYASDMLAELINLTRDAKKLLASYLPLHESVSSRRNFSLLPMSLRPDIP